MSDSELPILIDKEKVPFPKMQRRAYPWEKLSVGDSFLVFNATSSSVSSAASGAGKRLGRVFRCRQVEEMVNGKKTYGVRVWRIK
ncbi:MAG: hypothetical protein AAGF55_01125 [Pseudomonadota bacterium]